MLEAVFVTLLSHQLPQSELLAALLMYRAIYYLALLLIATLVYLLVEAREESLIEKNGLKVVISPKDTFPAVLYAPYFPARPAG